MSFVSQVAGTVVIEILEEKERRLARAKVRSGPSHRFRAS